MNNQFGIKEYGGIILSLILILLYLLSTNTGLCQWEPDVRLTNDPGFSFTSQQNGRSITANGNVLHVVWMDSRDGWEIYYKRSMDGGTTWGTDTRLTNDSNESEDPSIAVSGSQVHVVWWDNRDNNSEIYYKRSTDGGTTWGADTRLTNNTSNSYEPSNAVSGSVVHVVWGDNRDNPSSSQKKVYYKRSTDGGITWGADTRLTTTYSFGPSIAVSGQQVHVIWCDGRDALAHIYYKYSSDGGTTWGADTRLSDPLVSSLDPSIAVFGSQIHVVWCDGRHSTFYNPNQEIYYKHSTNSGITWGVDTRLTFNTTYSWYPSIAVSGLQVHVVWNDDHEIYYKRSTDGGTTWGADTQLTNVSGAQHSFVTVSGTQLNVVWYDSRFGNHEIMYKRNPTGNVGVKNISSEVPAGYVLHQNYPNPFNPLTKIKFEVPKTSPVKISVFDVTGREVAVLVNETLQAGVYETVFDAGRNGSGLTSGVYFCRMQGGNYDRTIKMLLIE